MGRRHDRAVQNARGQPLKPDGRDLPGNVRNVPVRIEAAFSQKALQNQMGSVTGKTDADVFAFEHGGVANTRLGQQPKCRFVVQGENKL